MKCFTEHEIEKMSSSDVATEINSRERLIESQKDLLRGCQNFLYRYQDGNANLNVGHALSQAINDHLLPAFMEQSK